MLVVPYIVTCKDKETTHNELEGAPFNCPRGTSRASGEEEDIPGRMWTE